MAGTSPQPTIPELERDVTAARRALRIAGVPQKLLDAIGTRALRTGRRQTGEFPTNREPRWTLVPNHPQYGTEFDCRLILLRLYATLLEFDGAPDIDSATLSMLEERLGRPIEKNSFRDELLLEKMSYADVVHEVLNPIPGISSIHIGHRDPTRQPKHSADNVEWRTERSNLIQGNLTLRAARTYLVEMIARYFELGEVTVIPD